MAQVFRQIADHPQLRWLGPHKGVVHLALASLTNACFDLWAKARGVPLWKLLLDLSPEAGRGAARSELSGRRAAAGGCHLAAAASSQCTARAARAFWRSGYPGYDTSIGWFHYSDEQVRDNVRRAVDAGFTAMKLKVGSPDTPRDIRRACMVREAVGPDVQIMLDANQQWTLPVAVRICLDLADMSPVLDRGADPSRRRAGPSDAGAGHLRPSRLPSGEHIPHRVLFKNYMQAGAAHFIQVDCTRVGGISEFITVSLLARKFGLPVVPHVGDMGQIHQHLVLFNHIALGQEKIFLEYIPHLRDHFCFPAARGGRRLSHAAGAGQQFRSAWIEAHSMMQGACMMAQSNVDETARRHQLRDRRRQALWNVSAAATPASCWRH